MSNTITFSLTDVIEHSNYKVIKFDSTQRLNELPITDVMIKLERGVVASDLLRKDLRLHINHYGKKQTFCGMVNEVIECGSNADFSLVRLIIQPVLWKTTLRSNLRIFQQIDVKEIITTILTEHDVTHVTFELSQTYDVLDYCTQYQETDFEFITRLCAENGICFYFKPNIDHVIFSDSTDRNPQTENCLYNPFSGPTVQESYIKSITQSHKITNNNLLFKDYDSYHSKNPLEINNSKEEGMLIDYLYPRQSHHDISDRKIKYKAQLNECLSNIINITANDPTFICGYNTDIEGYKKVFITEIHQWGTQPQALEEQAGDGVTEYNNTISAIPSHLLWRPKWHLKPNAVGTQLAIVSGADKEEIYCDDAGRIKIYFPWDKYNANNDLCSCWVRVSTPTAGAQYGFVAIPRVGQEVIISFLHGDPDLPYVSGTMFNALNQHPYKLPDYKASLVLRSESYMGSGYNELTFDNVSGKERIYLHAQRDYEQLIKKDIRKNVQGSQHITTDIDEYQLVKKDKHVQVDNQYNIKTLNYSCSSVQAVFHQTNKAGYYCDNELHIKANTLLLEASSKLTLKVGGSFISLEAAAISLAGGALNLNSGGSALAMSPSFPVIPLLPNGVEQIADAPTEVEILSFKKALSNGTTPRDCNS